MLRFGQRAKLKAEKVDEYIKLHKSTWPEVLKTLSKCNIQNYSIFMDINEVFSYFEYTGSNYEADKSKMEADKVTQEWWKHTRPCFLNHSEQLYFIKMDEIFHLN